MKVWVLALASWASSTRWMILARAVSAPMPTALTRSTPERSQVPANTSTPSAFSAGTDSPVILASSTPPWPEITVPSRYLFTVADQYDIAGHELPHLDGLRLPVTQHGRRFGGGLHQV